MEENIKETDVLNESEFEIYKNFSNSLNLDEKTRFLALGVIKEFKKNFEVSFIMKRNDIIPELLLSCSFFVASKKQTMVSVNGEKISGIGVSLSQIIRSTRSIMKFHSLFREKFSLQKFFLTLKAYLTYIKLENETKKDIKSIIDNFAFSFTIFGKYEEIFKKLRIVPKLFSSQRLNDETNFTFLETLKNIGWIIFSLSRSKLSYSEKILHDHPNNIVSNAALLICVIYEICTNLNANFQVYYFDELKFAKPEFDKTSFSNIEKCLCELIKLRDHDLFQEYLNKLRVELEGLKSSTHFSLNILDTENINVYHKRLENCFSHAIISAEELDERCFLQEERVYTPIKLTPFQKQSSLNNSFSKVGNQSNRLLSFNLSENMGISIKTSLNDFVSFLTQKIEKKPMASPYTPLALYQAKTSVSETPMTSAMEMYNWLQDYKNQAKSRDNLLQKIPFLNEEASVREQIKENAEKLILKVQENYRISDSKQILNFYCLLILLYLELWKNLF